MGWDTFEAVIGKRWIAGEATTVDVLAARRVISNRAPRALHSTVEQSTHARVGARDAR